MNYFKVIGLILGLIAMLKPVYMHLIPWDEMIFIKNAYKKDRPKCMIWIALVGLFLVMFTWYKELTTDISYSIYITILVTLSALKAILLLFDYKSFQKWISEMLEHGENRKIIAIDVLVGVIGAVIVIVSLKM